MKPVLLFAGFLAVLAVLCLTLSVLVPMLLRWLDARRARRAAAADPFPAVHMKADGEERRLICLPGGRNGRAVCRQAYRGRP